MLYNLLDLNWTVTPEFEKMRNRLNECTENDVDNFVEICFRQVAEDLGVKFKDIKDILYGRNIEFFEEKARLFNDSESTYYNDSELKDLMKKLKIPNTTIYSSLSPSGKFLRNFNDLTEAQKVEVLDALSSMKVEIPIDTIPGTKSEVGDFLNRFRTLSPTQKYEVVRSFSKLYVKKAFGE